MNFLNPITPNPPRVKINKMKKTIKQLENDLEHAQVSRDQYYNRWQELEKELKDKRNNEMFAIKSENGELANQVKNLLEIIRWQIRPNTAEAPFQPTKDQREENGRRSY